MKVAVTGANGMFGQTLRHAWAQHRPDDEVVGLTREDGDLREPDVVRQLLDHIRPDLVVHSAARVAGIAAKLAAPTDFLLDNLRLDTAVIQSALACGVTDLVYVSSAVVYPQVCEQPFVEEQILSGALEPANEGYAIAKAAGTRLCEYASRQHGVRYRAIIPSNLYGPFDHAGSDAHLVAAALGKVRTATLTRSPFVEVWGDGTARREFTFAPDLATWLTQICDDLAALPPALNVGCGDDHSVRTYYETACQVLGFEGSLRFDVSRPSGAARRILDSSRAAALGWSAPTSLLDGMTATSRALFATQPRVHDV